MVTVLRFSDESAGSGHSSSVHLQCIQHAAALTLLISVQVIGSWVAERSMDEVLAAMKEASVPSGPILSIADIFQEEQYQARNMFHVARPPSGVQLSFCSLNPYSLCASGFPDF